MEIKEFKIQVTPEQSRIVQQTLFDNGYKNYFGNSIFEPTLQVTYIYLNKDTKFTANNSDNYYFINKNLPELTFQEFFDTYVKWCIRGSKELALWQLEDMHDKCDYHFREKNTYYKPFSGLLYWSTYDKIPENHIEITFEQFKQYVLKTKEDKVMEKKIIGYKLKEDYKQYENAAISISEISSKQDFYSWIPKVGYNFDNNSEVSRRFEKAGVLDLWFEPVYEKTSKELYFGKVKFTIKKGDSFAITEYGKVTKKEIDIAINYIENPPKLNNYFLSIKALNSSEERFDKLDGTYLTYAFGCQSGTLEQLKEIYNAFE